jgi:16S rRNA (uracil1498-N3)-methyltransferase
VSHGPDGRHGPHAFVANLDAPALDPEDRHHFERVLRLRPGDELTVSDGAGRWRPCTLGAELTSTGPIITVAAPEPRLTVAFALVKGARPELVVQKLTELGIDHIVPFTPREASMQSRRCHLPEVEGLRSFAQVAAFPGAVRAERDGRPPTVTTSTLLIGPEGGWDDAERAAVVDEVAIGVQVLRAETAALAGATLLAALRSGLVGEAPDGGG